MIGATAPTRVLAVVVVFERTLSEVRAWPWLRDALASKSRSALEVARVLIYDNSPQPRVTPVALHAGCVLVHDPHNGGTAAAYSRACAMAAEANIGWLLLLDHDTFLPQDFLGAAGTAIATTPQARALVPWIRHGDCAISPARLTAAGTVRPLPRHRPVPADAKLTAIASGSLIHAPTLAQCLPLPSGLWLDYVDHWIFAELRRRGHTIAVSEAVLEHELSIAAPKSLSPRRLTSILEGEALFHDTLDWRARCLYPLRLLSRTLRYARSQPALARHTLSWMWQRMRMR